MRTEKTFVMMKRLGAALWIVAATGVFVSSSRAGRSQPMSCFVTTFNGDVQGMDLGASCIFRGIPFAAPPIGNLRWRPPQPAAPGHRGR
jgi:para-nitrobenzyl esterase